MKPSAGPIFLLLASALGAVDVGYFHVYRFRLFARQASRAETVIHLVQAVTFLTICSWICWGTPSRTLILGLFCGHFLSIAADILVEHESRASLKGVPPLEYLLHVAGATTTGAAFAAYLIGSPEAPDPGIAAVMRLVVLGGAAIAFLELWLFARAAAAQRRGAPAPRGRSAAMLVDGDRA